MNTPSQPTPQKHFVGLCGSVRQSSSNLRLLQAAQQLLPELCLLTLAPSLDQLPHFHPDIAPAQATNADQVLLPFIDSIRSAQGLIVSTPVYAGGYPGVLKNALDWLVGTDAFVDKPFMLLNASNRMAQVHLTLVTVLTTMSGRHIESASIQVNLLADQSTPDAICQHPTHAPAIRQALAEFADQLTP